MAVDTAVAICMIGMPFILGYLAMSIDKNNLFLTPLKIVLLILAFHFTWGAVAFASVLSVGISTQAAGIVNSILTTLTWTKWLVNILLFIYMIYWIIISGRNAIEVKTGNKITLPWEKKNGTKSN